MELQVHNASGAASVQVSDVAFGKDFNEALVHQVVTAVMAAARAGTKAQKTRSAVSGGGIKPWKQKGSGRARAGSIRSPLWRGGGNDVSRGPRDHSQKVNKRMDRGGLQCTPSEPVRQDRLVLVEDFNVSATKAKELAATLKELWLHNVLIGRDEVSETLFLAARN